MSRLANQTHGSSLSLLCSWQQGRTDLHNCHPRRCGRTGICFMFAPVGNMKDVDKQGHMSLGSCERGNV